ncbi:LysR family hydrogen peroxide-inducible transcriptional activator [Fluviicoccus keumensis]|uniref:LysR family hydrogen peroxide-inducible transcriptional activator n=1 Tax=Fluviicoccus keumensis TaxID=1435465 RepID=A0A4Q7ZAL7_9GAMM|nr:LysR substrate-binding domain-containing protein [Fluviicoccus keumensis]RZU47642.1 LysR family hydrogen peroxide-inducible transcriptional activator [Fluviicoccus keumensis]
MTLTDLRYLVTLAEVKHFARAAAACFVSQPTLSIAIKKLEDELDVSLFERHRHEVLVTPAGERIVAQAQRVLQEAALLKDMARAERDEFAQPLRLGAIFTVAPYLFPTLVPALHESAPALLLYLEENYTHVLTEKLSAGELDVILIATDEDLPETHSRTLFHESFRLLLPRRHPWAERAEVSAAELDDAPMLMLGEGHCFRDQILSACPVSHARLSNGNSLETLRHMVANGLGLTLIPAIGEPYLLNDSLCAIDVNPAPGRDIIAVWRRRFPRPQAVQALLDGLAALTVPGSRSV